MTDRFPAIFVSHGAPTLVIEPADRTHQFLKGLGSQLGTPKSVLIVSAHWEQDAASVSAAVEPATIHDFRGFPDALYKIRYPAAGAPKLAERVSELLTSAGIPARIDSGRGLDHGAWVPMSLMYPDADVPVAQLSVQTGLGGHHHLALGNALRPLRDEGVLILGSGGLTHNLGELDWGAEAAIMPSWASEFQAWIVDAIEHNRKSDLAEYRTLAPHAARNHPTEEHFLPLLVALGAADTGNRIHTDVCFGVFAMDAYRFD
jgi:4,5-DOPA dioxygenase extradiol